MNMRRLLCAVIAAFSLPAMVLAVEGTDVNSYAPRDYSIIPPSPEVGSLLEYKEIPVDHFSGLPDISFELFRLVEGNISIPIVLSYHGGGVRLGDKEGNAGLGWIVTAGASISRTIYGAPDETLGGDTKVNGLFRLHDDEREFRRNLITGYDYAVDSDIRKWMAPRSLKYAAGLIDVANDVFQLSGLGLSGTFIYNDDKKLVLSSSSPVNIEPSVCLSSYPTTFTVKNNSGLTYSFGNMERTKYTYFYGAPELPQQEDSVKYVSTWHISTIQDACGNKVDFVYDEDSGYEWRNSAPSQSVSDVVEKDLSLFCPSNTSSINTVVYYPRLLRKIESAGVVVEFDYDVITNGYYRKTLISSIEIKTKGMTEPVKRYDFSYTDMVNPFQSSNDLYFGRWKVLDGVKENGEKRYRFDYNTDMSNVFNRGHASCDFGGYYNNANNVGLVPSYELIFGHGADRSVNPDAAVYGSLKTIYYPTGGTTQIEWESNEFGYIGETKLTRRINNPVLNTTSVDTIRMCGDAAFKKLKISNYIVHDFHEITLDLTRYFLMNPANLLTTDYETSHEYEAEHYPINPSHYPHVVIKNSQTEEIAGVYFLDKNTIEVKNHNEPIVVPLKEGVYDIELLYPTSVDGAEDLLEAEFRYGDCIAGRIYIRRNIYEDLGGSGDDVTKDYWCGLRVRRILSRADDDDEPIIKDYFYGEGFDPTMSDGTVQMMPTYHHQYRKIFMSPYKGGYLASNIITISSTAFPNTPVGSVSSVQYPVVTTRLSKPDRYEPNEYLNYCIEQYRYSSSRDSENSDKNLTDTYYFQPVGARMYTSFSHRRGNLLSKKTGFFGNGETVSYSYNIFEPDNLDVFTTEPYVFSDYSNAPGADNGYGARDYHIGKYNLVPYNKTIASETLVDDKTGFSIEKTYQYFYDEYTSKLDYNLVKSTSVMNSEGEEEKVFYTYLKIGSNFSPLVETEVKICGEKIVSAIRNEYDPVTLLLTKKYTLKEMPSSINQVLSSNQATTDDQKRFISKPEYEYRYNERGNIVQISFNGTVLASYLWGYYGQHPIIEAGGVCIDDLLDAVVATGFNQNSVLSGEPYSDSQVKSLANAVRNKFPEADVRSLTYYWLVGVLESTDSRGVSTSYDYDALGRLSSVRDMNDKLIKKYDYHYVWEDTKL